MVPILPKAKIQHMLARVTSLSRPSVKKYKATGGPLILVVAAENPLKKPAVIRPTVLFLTLKSKCIPIMKSTITSTVPSKICKYAGDMAFNK